MKQKLSIYILLCFLPIMAFSACSQRDNSAMQSEGLTAEEPLAVAEVDITEFQSELCREHAAEYFRQYYAQKAENDTEHDYSHMHLKELESMVSSTNGVVLDTEKLTVEVAGALFSGNTAEIVLRVTAKELESVMNDEEEAYSSPYKFGDESFMLGQSTLGGSWDHLSLKYTYPDTDESPAPNQALLHYDTDESLAPNQFLLHYWISARESLEMDTFSIPLQDFGRIGSAGRMEPLYKEIWQVDIAVDPLADDSRLLRPTEELSIGNYRFTVDDIRLTSLSCIVHLRCRGEKDYLEENAAEIFQAIADGRGSFALNLDDGTKLTPDLGEISIGNSESALLLEGDSPYDEYKLVLIFNAPIAVEKFTSVELYGTEYSFG